MMVDLADAPLSKRLSAGGQGSPGSRVAGGFVAVQLGWRSAFLTGREPPPGPRAFLARARATRKLVHWAGIARVPPDPWPREMPSERSLDSPQPAAEAPVPPRSRR